MHKPGDVARDIARHWPSRDSVKRKTKQMTNTQDVR
jgi:hypothetical protein